MVCSTCAKKKTGVGFINENRGRIEKVLEKVSVGIKTIELSASERLSQIGEMKNRKRQFHETQFNFDKNKVTMPPLLRELFENTLSAHKVSAHKLLQKVTIKPIKVLSIRSPIRRSKLRYFFLKDDDNLCPKKSIF